LVYAYLVPPSSWTRGLAGKTLARSPGDQRRNMIEPCAGTGSNTAYRSKQNLFRSAGILQRERCRQRVVKVPRLGFAAAHVTGLG